MKTIVSVQEMEETETKPAAELSVWRKLVEEQMAGQEASGAGWISTDCPCCNASAGATAFMKAGVPYTECGQCGTLYAPRRPDETSLEAWYRDSEAARFWREKLLPASAAARLEHIVLPRVQWILDGRAEYVPQARAMVDVSSYGRPLLDELGRALPDARIMAAGRTADLEGRSTQQIEVKSSRPGGLRAFGLADIVLAFDAFDRAPQLRQLVGDLHSSLRPGGVLFAAVPVASGFEIQTLWERSPTVIPPDKVNLPTISGLLRLFAAPEWEVMELSTPGVFDVELVRRTLRSHPEVDWPRSVRTLVEHADAAARNAFTEYLQSQRLTSFARLVARRAG